MFNGLKVLTDHYKLRLNRSKSSKKLTLRRLHREIHFKSVIHSMSDNCFHEFCKLRETQNEKNIEACFFTFNWNGNEVATLETGEIRNLNL